MWVCGHGAKANGDHLYTSMAAEFCSCDLHPALHYVRDHVYLEKKRVQRTSPPPPAVEVRQQPIPSTQPPSPPKTTHGCTKHAPMTLEQARKLRCPLCFRIGHSRKTCPLRCPNTIGCEDYHAWFDCDGDWERCRSAVHRWKDEKRCAICLHLGHLAIQCLRKCLRCYSDNIRSRGFMHTAADHDLWEQTRCMLCIHEHSQWA